MSFHIETSHKFKNSTFLQINRVYQKKKRSLPIKYLVLT